MFTTTGSETDNKSTRSDDISIWISRSYCLPFLPTKAKKNRIELTGDELLKRRLGSIISSAASERELRSSSIYLDVSPSSPVYLSTSACANEGRDLKLIEPHPSIALVWIEYNWPFCRRLCRGRALNSVLKTLADHTMIGKSFIFSRRSNQIDCKWNWL